MSNRNQVLWSIFTPRSTKSSKRGNSGRFRPNGKYLGDRLIRDALLGLNLREFSLNKKIYHGPAMENVCYFDEQGKLQMESGKTVPFSLLLLMALKEEEAESLAGTCSLVYQCKNTPTAMEAQLDDSDSSSTSPSSAIDHGQGDLIPNDSNLGLLPSRSMRCLPSPSPSPKVIDTSDALTNCPVQLLCPVEHLMHDLDVIQDRSVKELPAQIIHKSDGSVLIEMHRAKGVFKLGFPSDGEFKASYEAPGCREINVQMPIRAHATAQAYAQYLGYIKKLVPAGYERRCRIKNYPLGRWAPFMSTLLNDTKQLMCWVFVDQAADLPESDQPMSYATEHEAFRRMFC